MPDADVVCLRPKDDFLKIGVTPPASLSIVYLAPDAPELAPAIARARALVIPAVGPKLPAALFDGARVELVQVTGAGIDRLDIDALRAAGIAVANVPGGSSDAIAEYAVSSAVALMRQTFRADEALRAGKYAAMRAAMVSSSLQGLGGMTVGVIGLGVIGMTVARAFHALGCRIVYHDAAPRDPQQVAQIQATSMALDELLECADIVTLHVPLLPSTELLLGARELGRMKAGCILINAARGGIVDEAALADALAGGRLGGAVVDVYSSEPPSASNPLLLREKEIGRRVLLTPHIAGVTRQSWAFLFESAWQNVERVLLHGETPENRVC